MADSIEQTGESATARAYRALERLIVTLELAPGSVTTERLLIERIGLGRTPVREAIQRLSWEGLVEVRPRAGLAIAPLPRRRLARVLDARHGVEIVMARSAARHVSREAGGPFSTYRRSPCKGWSFGRCPGLPGRRQGRDEAMASAADQSLCRAPRGAVADPQSPLLVSVPGAARDWPSRPNTMSSIIQAVLEGTSGSR